MGMANAYKPIETIASLRARVAELEAQNETLQSALEMASWTIEASKAQQVSFDSTMTEMMEPRRIVPLEDDELIRADKRIAELDEQIRRLREALEDLVDVQNGPPLYSLAEGWQIAMDNAFRALADHSADANAPVTRIEITPEQMEEVRRRADVVISHHIADANNMVSEPDSKENKA